MKGMMLRANQKATIVDCCHAVPAQQVAVGAFLWQAVVGRFPPGTVHVGVVDPGVGTARRLLCAAVHECLWLAPDNGLLGDVLRLAAEVEVRSLDLPHLGLGPEARTFHGRDVLAPLAGWLSNARYGFESLGPRVEPVLLPPLTAGAPRIVHVDGYGNLVSNVSAGAAAACRAVRIAGRSVPRRSTYGEAAAGGLLALINSMGLLEIAANGGSAARALGAGAGTLIELESP
jgi:hypothetical protein